MRLRKICGGFLLALMIALFGVMSVSADGEKPDYRLQISPVRLDLDLEPGTTSTGTFEVQNTGLKAYDFVLGVDPYSVTDENYSIDSETRTAYTDIVDWITFSQNEGHVEPNQNQEITVTVTVPDDVPAGGQYAMIYAEMVRDDEPESTGVAVNHRVALLVFSEVEGNTRREGQVLETKIPTILFNPPITATSLVENTGNVHTTATYTLQVFPLFGDEEVYTNEENPATLTILPETQRFNSISWDGAPQLGIFRVKQTVTIFDDTQTIEKIVFLCPIWFLFLILLIIFFVIFWLVSRARSRRRPAARASHRPSTPATHHEPKSSTDSEHPQEPQD